MLLSDLKLYSVYTRNKKIYDKEEGVKISVTTKEKSKSIIFEVRTFQLKFDTPKHVIHRFSGTINTGLVRFHLNIYIFALQNSTCRQQ